MENLKIVRLSPSARSHEKDALKACFLEHMTEVWSGRPKSQPAPAPDWCQGEPAVQKEFSAIQDEYQEFYRGDLVSPIFSKRNIIVPCDFIFLYIHPSNTTFNTLVKSEP